MVELPATWAAPWPSSAPACWPPGSGPTWTVPEPRLRQDVAFATVPRERPQAAVRGSLTEVPSSGLAVVYLHGGAWCALDKDAGPGRCSATWPPVHLIGRGLPAVPSRPTSPGCCRHQASRGLGVDACGRAGDPARSGRGGRAGRPAATWPCGRLRPRRPSPDPGALAGSDPRVCGVVSLSGQADLAAMYHHTSQHKSCRPDDPQPDWDAPPPPWMARLFGPDAGRLQLVPAGRLDRLVGGTPSEPPDRYAQLSPLHRVHPDRPTHPAGPRPTRPDGPGRRYAAPAPAAGAGQARPGTCSTTTTPSTRLATTWSPPARVAIHVLERFLATLAITDRTSAPQPISGAPAEPARCKHARCDLEGEEHEMTTTTRRAEELAAPWARWPWAAWSLSEAPPT